MLWKYVLPLPMQIIVQQRHVLLLLNYLTIDSISKPMLRVQGYAMAQPLLIQPTVLRQ
jgi:hypothetical protein